MTAEQRLVDTAGTLPVGVPPSEVGSFTLKRVDRGLAVVVGVGSLVMGLQSLLAALGPNTDHPSWNLAVMTMVFVPLALMVIACLLRWRVSWFAAVFAVVYPIALLLWPFTLTETPRSGAEPWIWYLINVATVAAVVAFNFPLQIVWTIGVPIEYAVVRLVQAGFTPDAWIAVGLDVTFALILGAILLTISWLFRAVAVEVDASRMAAVESFSRAAVVDAVEKERVAVAALMHDSVLAALIAAERAASPRESALAVAMAREALTRLANAESDVGEGSDEPVSIFVFCAALEATAVELGAPITVDSDASESLALRLMIPGRVARALALAAAQAMTNALQHAAGVGLSVTVAALPTGVNVVVRDSGGGFDTNAVPDDRLGIRGSIHARVAAVGGTSELTSGPEGTSVTLGWRAGA